MRQRVSVITLGVRDLARARRFYEGPEGQQLESVRPALERARHAGGDPDRVERLDLDDVVVELHTTGAREHDVDLLRPLVAVRERLALAGLDAVVAQPGALGVEVVGREPGLLG